jgi:hypothetical protein
MCQLAHCPLMAAAVMAPTTLSIKVAVWDLKRRDSLIQRSNIETSAETVPEIQSSFLTTLNIKIAVRALTNRNPLNVKVDTRSRSSRGALRSTLNPTLNIKVAVRVPMHTNTLRLIEGRDRR